MQSNQGTSSWQSNRFDIDFQLEVCVERIDDALLAVTAGATRIELNQALGQSGLTPSVGSCEQLCRTCAVPVVTMVRPHSHSFHYTSSEKAAMLRDCQDLLAAGAGGIVIGALDDNGWIDTKFLRSVAAICSPAEVVFHRAFDELTDQAQGLKQLIDCGIQRVLTSGGGRTAIESVGKLKRLIELADGCIEILPGSGVSSSNAVELVAQTGCTQLHGSFTNRETHLSCPDPQEIAATLAAVHAFFNERR